MKNIMVVLLGMLLSVSVFADGFNSKKEARKYADKMMDSFINKDFKNALDDAKKYWPIPEVEIDNMLNQIHQQWPVVDQRFGKAIAKEFIKEERIGKSFVRFYYLHKFENHSIYWQMDFYKPRDKWHINTILFLDNLEPLYE